jgi:hypothetical protein
MRYNHKNIKQLVETAKETKSIFQPSQDDGLLKVKPDPRYTDLEIEQKEEKEERVTLGKATRELYTKKGRVNQTDNISVKKVKVKKNTGVSSALPEPTGFIFALDARYKACIYQGLISVYDTNMNPIPYGTGIMVIDNSLQVFLAEKSTHLPLEIFQLLGEKVNALLVGETKVIQKQSLQYNCPITTLEYREGESFREYCKQSYIGDDAYRIISRTHFLVWLKNLSRKEKNIFSKKFKSKYQNAVIPWNDETALFNIFVSLYSRENILARKII